MNTRLLALLTILLLAGCRGTDPVATLTQRPQGVEGEVLSWTADTSAAGPRHTLWLSVDIDPAQLMGWTDSRRPYGALLYATLTAPDGSQQKATVRVPVTEPRKVGEDHAANTVQIAYLAAGEPLANGFRRVPPQRAFSFKPSPGTWSLAIRVAVPPSGEKKALRGLRSVRAELRARAGARGLLTAWDPQPPRRPKHVRVPLNPTP